MLEKWQIIEDYSSYQVSNLGRIRSKKGILKPIKSSNGYLHIFLYNNGIKKQFLLHRLVCKAFKKNIYNLSEINHIDGNKENNNINNLEWCTRKENVHHFLLSNKLNNTIAKKVSQFDLLGNKLNSYKSIREASRQSNIDAHNIIYCCRGQKKTAGNYIWQYDVS